jgi:putative ABC transport system permease protein
MTPIAFAWKSLASRPARAVLGIVGISVVGALLFDMLLLSRGLVVSFRDLLDSIGFDLRVTSSAALPSTGGPPLRHAAAAVRTLRALPEIRSVVPVRFGHAEFQADRGPVVTGYLQGTEATATRGWPILEGRGLDDAAPDDPVPAIVNQGLARELHLAIGSTLSVRGRCSEHVSVLPPVALHVVGIARFPFEGKEDRNLVTTLGTFQRLCSDEDADGADMLLVASRPGAGSSSALAAIRRALPNTYAYSTEQLLDRLQRTDFSYFRQISVVLSAITFFFAFLLIATLLTVSVNQRLGELAVLRALGVRRARIVADLFCEAALFVGIGGLVALPLGWFVARRLDAILRSMPGIPSAIHFFVFGTRAVLLHAALLGLSGLLAGLYPAWLAARLPIAATLRKEIIS